MMTFDIITVIKARLENTASNLAPFYVGDSLVRNKNLSRTGVVCFLQILDRFSASCYSFSMLDRFEYLLEYLYI